MWAFYNPEIKTLWSQGKGILGFWGVGQRCLHIAMVAVIDVTVTVLVQHCGSCIHFQHPSRLPLVFIDYRLTYDTLWFDWNVSYNSLVKQALTMMVTPAYLTAWQVRGGRLCRGQCRSSHIFRPLPTVCIFCFLMRKGTKKCPKAMPCSVSVLFLTKNFSISIMLLENIFCFVFCFTD